MGKRREVKTLHDFLPFSALTVLAEDEGARLGAVPTWYEFYDRNDMSVPVEVLHFQAQPFRDGANGVTIETLLAVILDRLHGYQRGPAASRENREAIRKLEEALMWLRLRIDRLVNRGEYRTTRGE
jgi:hypothetical protein